MVRPRRRQQRPLHARLSRYAADPCGTGYPHRGRTAGLRDGRSRRGRRVGRPGQMGRTARTVGIGKPLAHPRQSRGCSGSEHRGLRLRGQGCDPKRRDVLHRDLQHARPEQRTLRVRVPGQRLQTLPAGTCNHHFGPLCVEPHAPTPPPNTGTWPQRSKRGEASRCATSARPFVRSAGPSCPTLR